MARVLLIDDEPIYYKMIVHALKPHGYEIEYAKTGMDGLKTVPLFNPDVVITDVRLPDLSGYDIVQRLRRDPRFESIPIIFLTSQADLSNKLKAFEVGADDYLNKPFQPEELVARVGMLVRRGEILRAARTNDFKDQGTVIAVHSLRGGVGCTSMALNLAMTLYRMWEKPTIVVDSVMNAGQVALMLNASPLHTWEDLSEMKMNDMDPTVVESLICKHASGLDYIASPSYPIALDSIEDEIWPLVLSELRKTYEFIVIDTSHDFSNVAIHMLNAADQIIMMIAPEMASIRAAVCAVNIYEKLGYPMERIVPVISNPNGQPGIKQAQVEKVLKHPVKYTVPTAPAEFIRAINFGEPLVLTYPESPTAVMFEEAAYAFSKESLKNIPPAAPTPVWKRVTSRKSNKK